MKLLRFFEFIAIVMIIAGVLFGFGKVFVDQVTAMAMRPARTAARMMPASTAEKEYLAAVTQAAIQAEEATVLAEMKRIAGGQP